jgi:hypothetical protein
MAILFKQSNAGMQINIRMVTDKIEKKSIIFFRIIWMVPIYAVNAVSIYFFSFIFCMSEEWHDELITYVYILS